MPRRKGQKTQNCDLHRERHRQHLRVLDHRTGLPSESPLRVTIVASSRNRKLGPIPEIYVTASTCPKSCPLYNHGCYGESGLTRQHWRNVEVYGVNWDALCTFVAALPERQLWRYAIVGDLPGLDGRVDELSLGRLIEANRGRRGFGFTHKYSESIERSVLAANAGGFTVNFSANNMQEADFYAEIGPTVVVLPIGAPSRLKTPDGRVVATCPATYRKDVTCATCGLCSQSRRARPIIGFPAHGLRKYEVSELCSKGHPQ